MTRTIDPQAKALIQYFESCRLTAYQDQGGIWTIGWGHTGPDVVAGKTITQEQADALFLTDVGVFEDVVSGAVTVPLCDNQFGALVSFAYNVGGEHFRSSTLLRLLNAGDYNSVPSQLARWNKVFVNGVPVVSPGLAKRRSAEAQLWLTPDSVEEVGVRFASVTPTPVKETPLVYTKTIIGIGLAALGRAVDFFSSVDFMGAASQVNSFSDLGKSVHIAAFVLTLTGLSMAVYGRYQNRRDKGV